MLVDTSTYYQAVMKPQHVEVREATPADDFLIRNAEGLKIQNRHGIYAYGEIYQHYYILRHYGGEEFPLHKDDFHAAYDWVEERRG